MRSWLKSVILWALADGVSTENSSHAVELEALARELGHG